MVLPQELEFKHKILVVVGVKRIEHHDDVRGITMKLPAEMPEISNKKKLLRIEVDGPLNVALVNAEEFTPVKSIQQDQEDLIIKGKVCLKQKYFSNSSITVFSFDMIGRTCEKDQNTTSIVTNTVLCRIEHSSYSENVCKTCYETM